MSTAGVPRCLASRDHAHRKGVAEPTLKALWRHDGKNAPSLVEARLLLTKKTGLVPFFGALIIAIWIMAGIAGLGLAAEGLNSSTGVKSLARMLNERQMPRGCDRLMVAREGLTCIADRLPTRTLGVPRALGPATI